MISIQARSWDIFLQRAAGGKPFIAIDSKGAHYRKAVIVHAVFFYVCYAVSYRDLEEILAERGVAVDHATLNRWVVKYSQLIAANAQTRKRPTGVF